MMVYRPANTALTASLLVVLLAFAEPDTASAQAGGALAQCAAIENEATRLACYDSLSRTASQGAAAEASGSASAAQTTAAERGSVPEEIPATLSTDAAEPAESRRGAAEVTRSAAAPAAEPEQRGGLFRLRRNRNSDDAGEMVVVVDVRTSISDLRIFTTEDGRVYTQTSTDTIRHPEPPFDARLEPASFGSFFLIPDGSGRGVRVSPRE